MPGKLEVLREDESIHSVPAVDLNENCIQQLTELTSDFRPIHKGKQLLWLLESAASIMIHTTAL